MKEEKCQALENLSTRPGNLGQSAPRNIIVAKIYLHDSSQNQLFSTPLSAFVILITFHFIIVTIPSSDTQFMPSN